MSEMTTAEKRKLLESLADARLLALHLQRKCAEDGLKEEAKKAGGQAEELRSRIGELRKGLTQEWTSKSREAAKRIGNHCASLKRSIDRLEKAAARIGTVAKSLGVIDKILRVSARALL